MDARERLVNLIFSQGNPNDINGPSIIIGIEDFFEGNNDIGSIGCNLYNHPGINYFYSVLKNIKKDESVQDIFVEIHEVPEAKEDWPFSERIYILSRIPKEIIENWVSPLKPDDISEGWFSTTPKEAPVLSPGYKVYNIWWD